MTTVYPSEIDSVSTLPDVIDLVTPAAAETVNRLRNAIVAIEGELGVKPSGVNANVRTRLDTLESVINSTVTLGGDVGGISGALIVTGLQGRPVSSAAPAFAQILSWDGTAWVPSAPPSGGGDGSGGGSGIQVVATNTERDALALADRTEGMLVYVLDDGTGKPSYYQLGAGLSNSDWDVANFINYAQDIVTTGNAILGSVSSGPIQSSSLHSSVLTLEGKAIFNGIDSSVLSGTNQGIIYYDLSENKFKVSENGGAYSDLIVTNAVTPSELVFVAGVFNTSNTTATRIGARYIDLSNYPATLNGLTRTIKFVANLETTAGTAYIILYNSTDNEAVTGASFSTVNSTITTFTTGALTVGTGAGELKDTKHYEVQIYIDGGTASDKATCCEAKLVVSYS